MSDNSGASGFMWFIAGLGLGALVGVLYAPRAGRETREAIMNKAEEGREYMVTRARQAREQANEWVDRGREAYNRQKDQISAAVDAGRAAYRDATAESGKSKG
jgi:gas vesicle protein